MTNKIRLKKFLSYYRPQKKIFIIDMLCALSIAVIELLYPAATRHILKVVIPEGDIPSLLKILLLLLVLYIALGFLHYFVNFWGHMMGVYIESDMRRDLFKHLQKLPFKFYDNNRTGELMSRMTNDLNEVTELAHHGPEDIFLSIVMLIGSFLYLVRIEWRLAVVVFGVMIPLIMWFTITRRKSMSKAWRKVREKMGEINSSLENSIAGIRVSRAFTNEDYEKERFKESNHNFRNAKTGAYKAMAQYLTGVTFLIAILDIIVLAIGSYLIYIGELETADLIAFMLYTFLAIKPVNKFAAFTQQFQKGMTGFNRFCDILDEKPDIVNSEAAKVIERLNGDISLNSLSFSYSDNTTVLNNIDLKVKKGETVAIVGPTGSGKTTLCHLIPRFYDISEGSITIDDLNIKDIELESLRRSVGFVQQDVFLFTGTIKENILYGRPNSKDEEIIDAAKKAEIHDFIITLDKGYDTWVGEKGILLSGGQKQRIAIARAFLKNPPILIMDEATSALDNKTERRIQKALEELSKGRTSIIIAHRLSTVTHADKIVVLVNGEIEDIGTHNELYARDGLYRDLYDSQFN